LLDRLLIAATVKTGQWLQAERVTLFIVDRPARTLRSRVAQTDGLGMLSIEVGLDAGIAGHVARHGEIVNLANAYHSPLFNPEVDQRTGFRTGSVLCVPLRNTQGEVFAVAQALNKNGAAAFTESDVHRFQTVLAHLGNLLQQVLETEQTLRSVPFPPPAS
jgi:adenylate cyclase